MDPFTEKELIDTLKAINLNFIEMNVRLEGIEKAIRESVVSDDGENFGEAVVEDEFEEEVEEDSGNNPEVRFNISEEDAETQEDFKPEF